MGAKTWLTGPALTEANLTGREWSMAVESVKAVVAPVCLLQWGMKNGSFDPFLFLGLAATNPPQPLYLRHFFILPYSETTMIPCEEGD